MTSDLRFIGLETLVGHHVRSAGTWEGELQPPATIKEFSIVRQEGSRLVSRSAQHCNLDAIISVGYRVKSAVATRFHTWATQKLREFISPSTKIATPGCPRRGDAVSFTRKPTIWLPGQSKPAPN